MNQYTIGDRVAGESCTDIPGPRAGAYAGPNQNDATITAIINDSGWPDFVHTSSVYVIHPIEGRFIATTQYNSSQSRYSWATMDTMSDWTCFHLSQEYAEQHAVERNAEEAEQSGSAYQNSYLNKLHQSHDELKRALVNAWAHGRKHLANELRTGIQAFKHAIVLEDAIIREAKGKRPTSPLATTNLDVDNSVYIHLTSDPRVDQTREVASGVMIDDNEGSMVGVEVLGAVRVDVGGTTVWPLTTASPSPVSTPATQEAVSAETIICAGVIVGVGGESDPCITQEQADRATRLIVRELNKYGLLAVQSISVPVTENKQDRFVLPENWHQVCAHAEAEEFDAARASDREVTVAQRAAFIAGMERATELITEMALPVCTPAPVAEDGRDTVERIINWALFGTTDGDLVDQDSELPVGELQRLVREEAIPALLAAGWRPPTAQSGGAQ